MNRKHITIYDIAREADVSPATVSRILTGRAKVSDEKCSRVKALIEKYNFSPNAIARGLSVTHSRVIGMMLADAGNPYYNRVFSACVDEAYRRGYSVMMYNTLSRAELEDAALNKLLEQRVDVIVIVGGRIDLYAPDIPFMRMLEQSREKTPIVVASRSRWEDIYGVAVDHEGSMDVAMAYLLELGHRDIGFFYAGPEYYGTVEKLDRYRSIMERAGLNAREEWLVRVSSYDTESGREAIDALYAIYDSVKINYPFGQVVFELGNIQPYLDNLSNVYNTYMPRIVFGMMDDPEAFVAEFRSQLKAAGIDQCMEEIQSQIDAVYGG